MSLFIQNSSGLAGAGTVSALDAFSDVAFISNGDVNIGQVPVVGRPELEQVTYPVQAQTGPPPNRLFLLVNTNFGVNPQNIDIVIIAGGSGFMLNDGTLLTTVGGTSLRPGETHGGVNFNPTTSVVTLYDITQNGGQGFCAKPQDSSDLTLQTPNSAILYHELSHAFREATNSTLDGTESDCASASAEESAAETDENDMRDQLIIAGGGTPSASTRRDTGNHCGQSCGGSNINCCIVASIATGSPYSEDVSALRSLRDQFLRRSTIGLDFFDRLHRDYYSFSPQVCRLMARSEETRQQIERYFVRPLVLCLGLIRDYALEGISPAQLGGRFLAGVDSSLALTSLSRAEARELLDMLRGKAGDAPSEPSLTQLIEQRARPSEYVRWALIEPLEFYAEALIQRLDGWPPEQIGERMAEAVDHWGASLPLTETWSTLSNRAFREELEFLGSTLLRSSGARSRFAERLPAAFWDNDARALLLAKAGILKERHP